MVAMVGKVRWQDWGGGGATLAPGGRCALPARGPCSGRRRAVFSFHPHPRFLGSAPSVLSTLQVGNRGREVTAGRRQAGLQPVLLTSAQPG